jgi:hypothetical protein
MSAEEQARRSLERAAAYDEGFTAGFRTAELWPLAESLTWCERLTTRHVREPWLVTIVGYLLGMALVRGALWWWAS